MIDDYKTESVWLMKGDCLERMKEIPSGSVDMVLTDPPYGTVKGAGLDGWETKTNWDVKINIQAMLAECNRILRPNGALVLFAQDPYTSELITNAHGNLPFSYRYTWLKNHFANALIVNKAPVNYTEDILVFFKKYDTLNQHPLRDYAKKILDKIGLNIKEINEILGHRRSEHFFYIESTQFGLSTEATYNELCDKFDITGEPWFLPFADLLDIDRRFSRRFPRRFNLQNGSKYKSNVLEYKKDYSGHHPTQKPTALLEDLILTYTNQCDLVVDFTMGSGSTGVACKNLNRKFIGIELDDHYFEIGKNRILAD